MTAKTKKLPSRQVLEATHGRTAQFLKAVGTNPTIRALLEAHGYTKEEHDEGWRLLLAASGYQGALPAPPSAQSAGAREAMSKVDAWDEPAHRILRATLGRRFPEQADFLLAGLAPATGMESVAGVSTLLDRFDVLESGKGRKSTHKQDQAALALLAGRGIGPEKRKELRALIARAQQGEAALPIDPTHQQTQAEKDKAHEEALVALRHWFEEWSEIARAVVTRRDYLIQLGLARRRVRKA
jgi:hypothetical protein